MKLTIVLLTAFLFQVQAAGLAQSVTANLQKEPLRNVFKIVEKQTGVTVFYNDEYIKNTNPVTIDARQMPLADFLTAILKPEKLTFEMKQGNVVVMREKEVKFSGSPSQKIMVTGKVTDNNKNPLRGATIRVKGSVKVVVSDENGMFKLEAEKGEVLLITFVGFNEKEIIITDAQVITVVLVPSEQVLELAEVVSTGYQKITRERNTGSVAKVDMVTVATRSGSTNILQRLDGLAPGVVVNNAPGGEPLLIRGLTSLNSTRSPLIVVDGVELPSDNTSDDSRNNVFNISNPISNINPQDVEDITILRDASAASIWGAKAANGVIVITTKKGKAAQKLRVEYDGYYNFQGRPDRAYVPKLNSREFIAVAKEIFPQYAPYNNWSSVQSIVPVPPHLQIQYDQYRGLITPQQADKSLDSLASLDNRGEIADVFYRKAATTNHTVSLSGGGNVYSFYGSVSYTGIQSSTRGEKNNTYKLNLRQDFNLNKRLQLSLITDLTNTVASAGNLGNGITAPDVSFVPYQRFRDHAGNPLAVNFLGSYSDSLRLDYAARSRVNLDYVPIDEMNRAHAKSNLIAGRVVGSARLQILKGLRFEGTYGYQTFSRNSRLTQDQESYVVRDQLVKFTQSPTSTSNPTYWLPKDGGMLTVKNASQKNWTVRNQLVFDRNWDPHQLTVLFGQEATSITPLTAEAIYYGWDDQLQVGRPVNIDMLMKGITGTIPGGTRVLDSNNVRGGEGAVARTTSYYSTLGYMYDRRYALNASWRIDQSNLFGLAKSAQNRPVYSIGGKWLLNNEAFMKSVDWVNRLNVRFTYGITGNAPRPAQAASFDILQASSNVNYVNGVGLIVATPGNDKLSWEGTKIYNTGLDFTFFRSRFGGSIDLYVKKTTYLIGPLMTAPLTGYATVIGNYGDLENKGIEFSLNSININKQNFGWITVLNVAYNKNKITRMANATAITTGTGMINSAFAEGKPAYALFEFINGGLNASGDPQIIQADGKILSAKNGSKREDVHLAGTSQPIWTGGLFNTFTYKGFQLGVNISFNVGHVLFRDFNRVWSEPLYQNNIQPEFANRWKAPGDENKTNIPRFAYNSSIANARNDLYYQYSNLNSFNASYAKIREITLSYSLEKGFVQRIGAEGLTFRAQVSNLMLWKKNNFGIDPEFQSPDGYRNIRTGQGTITVGAHLTL
ncbi:SusC/RagA family TonB-linked outer membrane protein [Niastella caeni]|nr:SusC/RagA family TonB-linked outer membrane protein [Niastella caeni]